MFELGGLVELDIFTEGVGLEVNPPMPSSPSSPSMLASLPNRAGNSRLVDLGHVDCGHKLRSLLLFFCAIVC